MNKSGNSERAKSMGMLRGAAAAVIGITFLTLATFSANAAGYSLIDSLKDMLGIEKQAAAGTTAARTAVSTTLVISQVYGGGGATSGTPTYANDYVEIKNVSSSPQSLNTLSLYYGSATGNFASSATNAFALPDVTLNPGQYYLVQLGTVGTVGGALPVAPDATTTNLNLSAANGKVALATAGLAINTCGSAATPCTPAQLALLVDWVAYGAAGNGTAGNGEGGTSVNNGVSLTNTMGGVRKVNGCQDTDNNNNDFDVVTAPVPRNSSTAPSACAGGPTPTATSTGAGSSTPTNTSTATHTSTPTPTASPSPAQGGTLVISQVYGGGGATSGTPTYANDYIEIKNISSSPQSLNTLSLYYGSATGNFASSASNAFALPDVTLSAGQYYLVAVGAVGTVGGALPVTPDATTTNLTMSAANGKVAIATSGLAINTCGSAATPCDATQLSFLVDWVAYGAAGNGTAGNGEGGTSVNNGVSLTNTEGGVRKQNGCQDTNNNNNDFDVVTAPVPRNTSTTPAPCAAGPTPTATNTVAATNTSTATATSTNTPTNTPTAMNTATNTPTAMNTATSTDTPTNTPTAINTATSTNTPTAVNTATSTDTPTSTSTATSTNTPTNTPTAINTATSTQTSTPTNTPTITATSTATSTSTNTATPTPTPVSIFENRTPICTTLGSNGSPYPSTIDVANGPLQIDTLRVTLFDVTHLMPDNMDFLLVGPNGAKFILMADAGGAIPVASPGVTLTFSDAAGQVVPDSGPLTTGTFEPTSWEPGQPDFSPPAPAGPYNEPGSTVGGTGTQTLTGNFRLSNSNGTWSLYMRDDNGTFSSTTALTGCVGGGWQLQFIPSTAASLGVSGRVTTADGAGIRNARVVITGNSLTEPLVATTGSFGFYTFDGLRAGETYVVTVNSQRYTFSAPSRVVSLVDNVADADFVADPQE
jgi:Lamin Tail Domain/Carboxypeptidase regulatory-like domain